MGRFKRILGSREYCNYTTARVDEAVRSITQGRMTQRGTSEAFGIPRSTLQNKIINLHTKTPGGQPVLTSDEETKIVAHILLTSKYGFPLDSFDLRKIVKTYLERKGVVIRKFHDNLPGPEWVRLFLKRHPELTQRFAANIKSVRAAVSPETINAYFDNLQQEIEGIPAENIWNYDESNLSDDPGNKKIITKRGCKYPERIINSSKQSTSVMFCGNAMGSTLPPYVVYKSIHLYDSWMAGGPDGTRFNRSKSGWFEASIFEDWFEFLLLPALRRLEGTKIVIGDNLSSHLSMHVLDLCAQHDIKFICLPPNTTHLTQPLDIAYFRPLKMKWRQIITDYKLSGPNKIIAKSDFPRLLKSLTMALSENGQGNLRSGFEKSGIYPLNREKVLQRIPTNENLDPAVQQNVSASIIELLETRRFSNQVEAKTRKKKVDVKPGKIISTVDLQVDPKAGPSGTNKLTGLAQQGRRRKRVVSSDSESSLDEPVQSEQELSDEFAEEENDEPPSSPSTDIPIQTGNFVLFLYEKKVYPGQVVEIKKDGSEYKIKSLTQSGTFQWKWPQNDDILWYDRDDILKAIKAPEPSKRGFFVIKEINNYYS